MTMRAVCLDCTAVIESGEKCCYDETDTLCNCETCLHSVNACSLECDCSDMGRELADFCQRCYERYYESLKEQMIEESEGF